jgi:hypothetical protein
MYFLMMQVNEYTSAEDARIRFSSNDLTGKCITLPLEASARCLHLNDIRRFIDTLVDEIKTIILKELFFGYKVVDDIDTWLPEIILDEPQNKTPGYSCFNDRRNKKIYRNEELMEIVLNKLNGRFHYTRRVDQKKIVVWKTAACLEYLHTCQQVEMMLFAATHASVGPPPRGTEAESQLIQNIDGGSSRNIIVLFRHFCSLVTHTKNSHQGLTDVNTIQLPHPKIGRLWMLYLTFVRPLVVALQKNVHGEIAAKRAESYLFFGLYKPIKSKDLSKSFSLHTQRILGTRITLRLWRQIVTWILDFYSAMPNAPEPYKPKLAALATQMGHSTETHGLYGSDSRLPTGCGFHSFFQSTGVCGYWHKLVYGESELLKIAVPSSSGDVDNQSSSLVLARLNALMPDFERLVTKARINSIDEARPPSFDGQMQHPPQNHQQKSVTGTGDLEKEMIDGFMLPALTKAMTGQPDPTVTLLRELVEKFVELKESNPELAQILISKYLVSEIIKFSPTLQLC